jgi:hypothetical protein
MRCRLLTPRLCAPLLSLAIAAAASAVIIDSGDGTGNVTAPSPDPGWSNVGKDSGGSFAFVYLDNGWVLTANHVGAGDTIFQGVPYPWLPGTAVQLHNPDSSLADLVLFRLAQPYPPLPSLAISTSTPPRYTSLVMIGNGRNRGAATSWMGIGGYTWGTGTTMRWGTNVVTGFPNPAPGFVPGLGTYVFATTFDQAGLERTTYEAQAAQFDSGGAVFAGNTLVGTMIAVGLYPNQSDPQVGCSECSLYGQVTYMADLSVYRDEIVSLPEPVGGLFAGAALVVMLRRRRPPA